MTKKAYIFDLDGTILDSGGLWAQIDRDFLGLRGLSVPADYEASIASMSLLQAAEYTVQRFGFPETPEELMNEFFDMALAAYRDTVPPIPGAVEYILAIKSRGHRLALATAAIPEFYVPALTRLGIYDAFDLHIASGGTLQKDEPAFYRDVAQKLDCSCSDCIFFDDVYANITAAKSAGMQTVFLRSPEKVPDGNFPDADQVILQFTEIM